MVDYGLKLQGGGLVFGRLGNISVRLDEKHMLITPLGSVFTELLPQNIVIVNYYHLTYRLSAKPSSECGLHASIYRARPEANAIIHTHSPNASVLAASGRNLPFVSDDVRKYLGGASRVADYAIQGTKKQNRNALRALTDRNGCFLSSHGTVVFGANIADAFKACKVMEDASAEYIKKEIMYFSGKSEISVRDVFALFAERKNN